MNTNSGKCNNNLSQIKLVDLVRKKKKCVLHPAGCLLVYAEAVREKYFSVNFRMHCRCEQLNLGSALIFG